MSKYFIWVFVTAVAVAIAGGFFAGKYYTEKNNTFDPQERSRIIDSLEQKHSLLLDSLREKSAELSQATITRIRYQTEYDTIRVYEVPEDIINALNKIIAVKPE